MSTPNFDDLRTAHAASTPGEWGEMPHYKAPHYICCPHEGDWRVLLNFNGNFDSWCDWYFVTLAHNRLPSLFAALDAATARVRELEAALKAAQVWLTSENFNPPVSCGGCGTPNGNCDGECMDASYWGRDCGLIRAALAARKGPP